MNGLGKNRTWAGVLDLPQNPDFSGFASRFFWKHVLPGLADWHVGEAAGFPALLSPQSGGRRRCFKSIRAGRNIRDLNGSVPVHPSVQNYWGFFLPGDPSEPKQQIPTDARR